MSITASGSISLSMENLRTLIANTTAWRSWVTNEGDPVSIDAAKERIYLVDLPPPPNQATEYAAQDLQTLRPWARIDLFESPSGYGDDSWASTRESEISFVDTGRLLVDFVDEIPDELKADAAAAKLNFLNNVGAVVDEIKEISGTDAFQSIRRMSIFMPAVRCDETLKPTQGDFWRIRLLFVWGI